MNQHPSVNASASNPPGCGRSSPTSTPKASLTSVVVGGRTFLHIDPERYRCRGQPVDVRRAAGGCDGTFLLDQGEELRTVMELLGHSTVRLTTDTYGDVLPTRA